MINIVPMIVINIRLVQVLFGQDPNSIDQGYARTIEFGVPLPNKDFQLRWSSDSGGARRLGERNRK